MIRILIVDDEEPIRDLLAQTISAHGEDYAVVGVAGDGDEAMERCRELRPDIVITDICMPAVSGLAFLQAARAEGLLGKTVIISGYDEFDYARQAISLGVTDYLLKPFLPGTGLHNPSYRDIAYMIERVRAPRAVFAHVIESGRGEPGILRAAFALSEHGVRIDVVNRQGRTLCIDM